jgi:hypothetical protein
MLSLPTLRPALSEYALTRLRSAANASTPEPTVALPKVVTGGVELELVVEGGVEVEVEVVLVVEDGVEVEVVLVVEVVEVVVEEPEQPGIALQTSSLPPVRTSPDSDGSGSTLFRMSAFSAVVPRLVAERINAAAPETCAAAIEPPLMYPKVPFLSVE